MGHSAEINSNIYQSPLAEAAILKVGSQLMRMDGGLQSDNGISSSRPAATFENDDDGVEMSQIAVRDGVQRDKTAEIVSEACGNGKKDIANIFSNYLCEFSSG